VGGPALHTIFLSHGLSNDHFETILVGGKNNSDEKSMLPLADELGVKYKIIEEMGREINFLDDLISLYKLYRLIRKEKPDIVHTHTAKAGTIGRLAAWLARVPKIYHTFHGHIFDGYFSKRTTKFYIFIERILTSISTNIIVISNQQKKDIVTKYRIAPQNKVIEIPLGFNWRNFKNPSYYQLRSRFNISKDKYLIAFIGRIVPIKDYQLFLDIAFQLLRVDRSKYHFVVIGDGDLKTDMVHKINQKEYQSSFSFTGWLDLNMNVYQEIDLLLLTSLNEGTPVTVIEALVSGTPVVASDVGGVRDILKFWDKDSLISSREPQKYIDRIFSSLLPRRISTEVSENIARSFGMDRLKKDIQNLYETAIAKQQYPK
jgi:glycosyltransferase involved in cell wall biosynthesis